MKTSVFLFIIFYIYQAYTSMSCEDDSDCYSYEICFEGYCKVDMKMPGEACVANIQCTDCCDENYVCKGPNDTTKCGDDLDGKGLGGGLAIFIITGVGAMIGAYYYSKRIILGSSSTDNNANH